MQRIKKNDSVFVISGKDKGKKGEVIAILPKKDKVMVKGIALVSKHYKARRQGEVSGIKKIESFIDASKVMPVCTSCSKPSRVGVRLVNDERARICLRCSGSF